MDGIAVASYKEDFRVQSGSYSSSVTAIRARWSKGTEYKMKITQSITCYIVIKAHARKCMLW